MKLIGVNGSPRKTWNSATLLSKALEGGGIARGPDGIDPPLRFELPGVCELFRL